MDEQDNDIVFFGDIVKWVDRLILDIIRIGAYGCRHKPADGRKSVNDDQPDTRIILKHMFELFFQSLTNEIGFCGIVKLIRILLAHLEHSLLQSSFTVFKAKIHNIFFYGVEMPERCSGRDLKSQLKCHPWLADLRTSAKKEYTFSGKEVIDQRLNLRDIFFRQLLKRTDLKWRKIFFHFL